MGSLQLEDLENIRKERFKEEVKEKVRLHAFEKLMLMKSRHSKLAKLNYKELKMQEYLEDRRTTIQEKILTFKWRVRMERFEDNFRGGKEETSCPLCKTHEDSQWKSFQCPIVMKEINVKEKYEYLFGQKISKEFIQTLRSITSLRSKEI